MASFWKRAQTLFNELDIPEWQPAEIKLQPIVSELHSGASQGEINITTAAISPVPFAWHKNLMCYMLIILNGLDINLELEK